MNRHIVPRLGIGVIAALCCAALFAPARPAAAWGPVTHAYMVLQIFPNAPPQAVFGAMAADMNDFAGWMPGLGACFKQLTHSESRHLRLSPFRLGMLTHNAEWGADSYAHAYFHLPTEKKYPMVLFEQLSHDTGITMHQAEDCIETVMDYVVARDLGPTFIARVAAAADAAGPNEEYDLVQAYTARVMQAIPQCSREQAAGAIRALFHSMKLFLANVAVLLSLPDRSLQHIGPTLLAAGLNMSMAQAAKSFDRAVCLCADWREHVDQISQDIAGEFRTFRFLCE